MLMLGAVCALAACSGGTGIPTAGTAQPGSPVGAHLRAHSWMAMSARETKSLLYVSNAGNGTVTVYDYQGGNNLRLVGTLTGFATPEQPCVDASGDVFVPDAGAASVVEYAHGGTTPIATLSYPGGSPYSCSVDVHNTGNLAVSNNNGYEGNVGIYAAATGSPTTYRPGLSNVFYLAYDPSGDLFADGFKGYGSDEASALAELPSGGAGFSMLTVAGANVTYPQQLQWSGQHLLVGDLHINNGDSGLYRMKVSGDIATVIATTQFTAFDQGGFWKENGRGKVVAASAGYGHGSNVYVYNYPSGSLYATLSNGISVPEGVAISVAR